MSPQTVSSPQLLTNEDLYLFNEGSHYRLYEKMGAHARREGGATGTDFAVWAPGARQVSVMGDFNGWNKTSHLLQPRGQSGIWEAFSGKRHRRIPDTSDCTGRIYHHGPFSGGAVDPTRELRTI